jgi:hypothetical protein
MIADAAAVGVVNSDSEIGLVVEHAVDDMRGLAGWRDRGDMEGRVPGRVMRVEQR